MLLLSQGWALTMCIWKSLNMWPSHQIDPSMDPEHLFGTTRRPGWHCLLLSCLKVLCLYAVTCFFIALLETIKWQLIARCDLPCCFPLCKTVCQWSRDFRRMFAQKYNEAWLVLRSRSDFEWLLTSRGIWAALRQKPLSWKQKPGETKAGSPSSAPRVSEEVFYPKVCGKC